MSLGRWSGLLIPCAFSCAALSTPVVVEAPPVVGPTKAGAVVAGVARHAVFAPLFASSAGPARQAPAIEGAAPTSAASPARVAVRGRAGLSLSVRATDLSPTAAEVVEGHVVFPDAAPATDVVWTGSANALEELRVLRDPRAASHARYHVRPGPAVAAVRVTAAPDGDEVEVLDDNGVVRLASAPLFAVDATGARHPVHAELTTTPDGLLLDTWLDPVGLAYPVVVDPAWSAVPSMASARDNHAIAVLAGDVVLVTGGNDTTAASNHLATAELFDAKTKTWAATAAMAQKRANHTATVLSSGKVLVVGGFANSSGDGTKSAEIYDPVKKTWAAAAPMTVARGRHTATLLPGDKVLIVGGTEFTPGGETNTAEVYDAATNTWAAAGVMATSRRDHTATLLGTGKVLIAGGRRGAGNFQSGTELYDPATKAWANAGAMAVNRAQFAAALLGDGRVLVSGGVGVDGASAIVYHSVAEIYDPVGKSWKATTPMASRRMNHALVPLLGQRALAIGGEDGAAKTPTVELFTVAADRFVAFPALGAARSLHGVGLLSTSDILVVGGRTTATTATAELLTFGRNGEACTDGAKDCASGRCVDGVCCNTACDGQCEACDVAASKGTCSPVKGAPHGPRVACSDGAGSVCQAKSCDGVEPKSCAAFADAAVVCAAASCVSGSAKPEARCDGKGACAGVTATSCAPYACGGAACKTKCTADSDCAGSNVCDLASSTCVSADSTCTADGLASQPVDRTKPPKECAPYRCNPKTGACFDRCDGSDACQPGLACDLSGGTCVAASVSDEGGCALASRTGRALPGAAASILLLASVVARRRRRP
ncbi:MAG: hypothetical protein JNL79_05560 [Myxococcales bacterium]|nr:hypothetical protein [Myxococcales bacterium]